MKKAEDCTQNKGRGVIAACGIAGTCGSKGYRALCIIVFIAGCAYGKVPLGFELNQGQTDAGVKFLTRASAYTLFLKADEAVFAGQDGSVERVKFPGANRNARVEPLDKQAGYQQLFPRRRSHEVAHQHCYLRKSCTSEACTEESTWSSTVARGRLNTTGWCLRARIVRQIRMKWEVAGQIRKDSSGNLALGSALFQKKPVILQEGKPIEGGYVGPRWGSQV